MKKVIAAILLSVGLITMVPASASANSATVTKVQGTLLAVDSSTNQNYGVVGADVKITCNGHDKFTTSIADGKYKTEFTADECPLWSTVDVVATKGSLIGIDSEPAIDFGTVNIADVTVNMTEAAAVPEMGTVIAIGTSVAAVGAIAIVRRRSSADVTV